jgi:chromosome segregation ATPase
MNGLSIGITESINKLNQAESDLEKVISALKNISQDVNTSSGRFGESQLSFSKYSTEFLQNNSKNIQEIQKSLSTAKEVSSDYAKKFEVIEKGLQGVFAKINTGLKDYQITVGQSLEQYLGKYTEHLTNTTASLAAAQKQQEDILEELTEQLSRIKDKRM